MKKFLSVILSLALVLALAGCVPGSADKAKAKLEKKGYEVTVVTEVVNAAIKVANAARSLAGKDQLPLCKEAISASLGVDTDKDGKVDKYEDVSAVWFEKAADAKLYYEYSKDEDGKTSVVLSGKVVYSGSEAGMKAFK